MTDISNSENTLFTHGEIEMARSRTTRRGERYPLVSRFFGGLAILAVSGLLISCGGGGGDGSVSGADPNSAVLAWDASASSAIRGYRVYFGTTQGGPYLQPPGQGIDVGNVTTYVVTGLSSNTTYYFVATAYDTSLNESSFSNEVSETIS